MSRARHSWEMDSDGGLCAPLPSTHDWESEATDSVGSRDSGSEDPCDSPLSPSQEFIEYALSLHLSRGLSAKELCQLMYSAGKAGIPDASRYGLHPDSPSGHFQRHLKGVMGCYTADNYEKLYALSIPAHTKWSLGRAPHTLHVIPPHKPWALTFEPTRM